MAVARVVLLVIHLLGVLALLVGLLVQARRTDKKVSGPVRDGAGTAFLAGLFLVGVDEGGAHPLDHLKIAVKFGIGLLVLVLVMANLRRDRIPGSLWAGLLVLTLGNVGIALLWH